MTLIVGFNFGAYALLAADTRVSWYINEQLQFRDDSEKIRRTRMGLITGAGLINLLEPVKQRMDEEEIAHTDTIISFIREQLEHVRAQQWANEPRVRESIAQTAWMFTYVTAESPPLSATPGSATLRLVITIPDDHDGHKLATVAANDVWLFPPTGTSEEQFEQWRRLCNENMEPWSSTGDISQHLLHHIGLTAQLVRDVADLNEGVGPTFQVGVHVLFGQCGVSSILGTDSQVTFDWGTSHT